MSLDKGQKAGVVKVEHCCMVCGSSVAPFGFNGRFTCRDHRAEGELLMAATVDGVSGGWVHERAAAGGVQKQGKLL